MRFVGALAVTTFGLLLSVAMSGCDINQQPEIKACENFIRAGLDAPSTYKRIAAHVTDMPKEKQRWATVEYDAQNKSGVPLRDSRLCRFQVADAKVDFGGWELDDSELDRERNRISIRIARDSGTEPECCLPPGQGAADQAAALADKIEAEAEAKADEVAPEPATPEDSPPAKAAKADLCWQDYCPCEPPQGGPDQLLCRRLRAGLPVDDEQMSLGAGLRDARQEISDFEAEHGKF